MDVSNINIGDLLEREFKFVKYVGLIINERKTGCQIEWSPHVPGNVALAAIKRGFPAPRKQIIQKDYLAHKIEHAGWKHHSSGE